MAKTRRHEKWHLAKETTTFTSSGFLSLSTPGVGISAAGVAAGVD